MAFQKNLIVYETKPGKAPFEEWLLKLKDRQGRAKIRIYLDRLEQGNMSNCASVGKGVFELRVNYGPGYRVYFGQDGKQLIILLCGGDKSTQRKDILKAQGYWDDYRRHYEKIS